MSQKKTILVEQKKLYIVGLVADEIETHTYWFWEAVIEVIHASLDRTRSLLKLAFLRKLQVHTPDHQKQFSQVGICLLP